MKNNEIKSIGVAQVDDRSLEGATRNFTSEQRRSEGHVNTRTLSENDKDAKTQKEVVDKVQKDTRKKSAATSRDPVAATQEKHRCREDEALYETSRPTNKQKVVNPSIDHTPPSSQKAIGSTDIISKDGLRLSRNETQSSRKGSRLVSPNKEDFGQKWYLQALERLSLPKSPGSQLQFMHELNRAQSSTTSFQEVLETEKLRIKTELKQYDAEFAERFGHKPGREEKEPIRGLYTYYGRVKQVMEQAVKRADAKKRAPTAQTSPPGAASQTVEEKAQDLTNDEICLQKLEEEKLRIKAKLQQFQHEFSQREGRPIKYHSDIVKIEVEYKQYKQVREHINRLTESIRRKAGLHQLSSSTLSSQHRQSSRSSSKDTIRESSNNKSSKK